MLRNQKKDYAKSHLRLVGGWLEKTMKDLDRLLKEIFQDKSAILAHLTIERGSVIVNYLIPQSRRKVSHRACKAEDNVYA